MKRFTFTFLLIIGLVVNTLALPIPSRPLRQLVMESEHIIVGYVVKTFDKDKKQGLDEFGYPSRPSDKIAQISISEQLQGKIEPKMIEVIFNPHVICPEPTEYFDSTYVIAFLDKKVGLYETHALNYGVKTLTEAEIKVYKKRILEIQTILKNTNKTQQFTETVEWLVKCAENETTCWEGVYELHWWSGFMYPYLENEGDYDKVLSTSQKQRLKKALFKSKKELVVKKEINQGLAILMDVVYLLHQKDKKVKAFFIKKLKSIDYQDNGVITSIYLIKKLNDVQQSDKVASLLQEAAEIQFSKKDDEMITLIKECIQLLE